MKHCSSEEAFQPQRIYPLQRIMHIPLWPYSSRKPYRVWRDILPQLRVKVTVSVVVKPRLLVINLPLITQLAVGLFVGCIPKEASERLRDGIGAIVAPQPLFTAPDNVTSFAAQLAGGARHVRHDIVQTLVLFTNFPLGQWSETARLIDPLHLPGGVAIGPVALLLHQLVTVPAIVDTGYRGELAHLPLPLLADAPTKGVVAVTPAAAIWQDDPLQAVKAIPLKLGGLRPE
ncbi:hypothetical protein WH06_08540, partial [Aeromonas salmonicida subsp. salmonicida]